MKIVFLDIDGVLNTNLSHTTGTNSSGGVRFDREALANLFKIVRVSNSKIVISSTWRQHRASGHPLWQTLLDQMRDFDLDREIIDTTEIYHENVPPKARWQEIRDWLENNRKREIESFVILDDEWSMGELGANFVRCSPATGLSSQNADEALEILHRSDVLKFEVPPRE